MLHIVLVDSHHTKSPEEGPQGASHKAVYLNDEAEPRRFVDIGFDRVRDMLNAMSPEDLAAEGRLFGRIPLPKWQIIKVAVEHGIWTLGATVPYVRLQGGTPHSFNLVPAAN